MTDHQTQRRRRTRLIGAGAAAAAAGIAVAAFFASAPRAPFPEASAAPGGATPTTAATATTATTSEPAERSYASDDRGYLDSAARCDAAQALMEFGRTGRALVAICVAPDGALEYRGERLSDAASITMPAGRAADGSVIATNDGVTYAVSPTMLLVSEGDTVLYRDSWTEFSQPRFSPGATTGTTTTVSTPTVSTTTVSTTTVTPTR